MITNRKQIWSIGSVVKVGFMKLRVTDITHYVSGLPDVYALESLDGSKQYEFVPDHGINRIN